MQKFIPIALMAILIVGCKGGGTTASTGGGGSTTGTTSASSTHTLKFNPKQGERYSYVISSSVMGKIMDMGMTIACDKVEGDKITTVTTIDGVKMDGKDLPAAASDSFKKMKIINLMDSSGKTLSTKMEGAPAGMNAPESPVTAFPAGPVKVGDTWGTTMKMQGADVKVTYKLASVAGNQATLESRMEGLPGGVTQDGPGITVLDMSTGMPISTKTVMKMKGPDGKDMAVSSEMKRK